MLAVILNGFGGLDAVDVAEVAAPEATGDTVAVEVAAAALGPWDVQTASGLFAGAGGMTTFPQILGWDFAGTVRAVGANVEGLAVGQRVAGFSPQPWSGIGAFAQTIRVPPALVAPLPDEVDFAAGAALPVSGLTARRVLETAGLGSAESALVVGAAGAVGGMLLQLGRGTGARLVASVAARDAEAVRALGATDVVDRDGDVADDVRALVPGGVDVCIDLAGPAAWEVGLAAVRDGGRFVTTSPAPLPHPERGITAAAVGVTPDADALAELARSCAGGELVARVGVTVALADAVTALRKLGKRPVAGKVVLDMTGAG